MENYNIILLILPLVVLQIVLLVLALIDISKREKVVGNNKLIWYLIIIFINILGPIIYFIVNKKE